MHLEILDRKRLDLLESKMRANAIRNCYPASRIEIAKKLHWPNNLSDFLVAVEGPELHSAVLTGANIVPIDTTNASRQLFAEALAASARRCSAIIGPYDEVHELWSLLESSWGSCRDIRNRQYVLAITNDAQVRRDESVRFAQLSDLDDVFPVCVDMFTAELGVSPFRDGGQAAYRARISELLTSRRAFVKYADGQVVFKAEIGSVAGGVAQMQGVWLHPDLRGHGLSVPALAQVVHLVRQFIADTVSLVVNDFNQPAIKAYSSVGFKRVDTFATVLF